MTTYTEKSLLPDERVVYSGRIHWIVYRWTFFWVVLIILLTMSGVEFADLGPLLTVPITLAIVSSWVAHRRMHLSEFSVTNKRVIIKKSTITLLGAFSSTVNEIYIDRIESVEIKQNHRQEAFGYGTLIVAGTGSAKAGIDFLANVIDAKKAVYQAHETNKNDLRNRGVLLESYEPQPKRKSIPSALVPVLGFVLAIVFIVAIAPKNNHGTEKRQQATLPTPQGKAEKISTAKSRGTKTEWWVLMFRECKYSKERPEQYEKNFPCRKSDSLKDLDLVVLHCRFQKSSTGIDVETNLIFSNSKTKCQETLAKIEELERMGLAH